MTDNSGNQPSSESIDDRLQAGEFNTVFQNRELLDLETVIEEDRIVGRDDQLDEIISAMKPVLHGHRPPNMLLYGPSGTGKSLIINSVCERVISLTDSQDRRFGVVSINCQELKSHDRAVYRLAEETANTVGVDVGAVGEPHSSR